MERANHFSYLFPPCALSKIATRNFFTHCTRGMAQKHRSLLPKKFGTNDTNKQIPLYTVYQLYVGCSSATWDDFQQKCNTKDANPKIFRKLLFHFWVFWFGCQKAWTFQVSTIAMNRFIRDGRKMELNLKIREPNLGNNILYKNSFP